MTDMPTADEVNAWAAQEARESAEHDREPSLPEGDVERLANPDTAPVDEAGE